MSALRSATRQKKLNIMPVGIGAHLGPIYGYHRFGGRHRHGLLASFIAFPLWLCWMMLLWSALACWWLLKWSAVASVTAARWIRSTGWPWARASVWPSLVAWSARARAWLPSRGRHAAPSAEEVPAWATATMPQEWMVPGEKPEPPRPTTTVQ